MLNTNETVNYGMVQMSGGRFLMDYDRELTCFKASCLSHDVVDIFAMVADCALEPRSVVAAQVALKKNDHSHKLDDITGGNSVYTDNLFRVAFGHEGLGRPLMGARGNVANLSSYTLQKFQLENINPQKVVVTGVGIDSHREFVDLVSEKLNYVVPNLATVEHAASQYQGGELRALTESGVINLAFAWEGGRYGSEQWVALQLAAETLGSAAEGTGALARLLAGNSLLDTAEAFNFSFRDSGLFGLKVSGSATNSGEILSTLEKTLKEGFAAEDLERAKGRLRRKVLERVDRPFERVELLGREHLLTGTPDLTAWLKQLSAISLEQVNSAYTTALKGRLSFNAKGGLANRLPSYDSLSNMMRA